MDKSEFEIIKLKAGLELALKYLYKAKADGFCDNSVTSITHTILKIEGLLNGK